MASKPLDVAHGYTVHAEDCICDLCKQGCPSKKVTDEVMFLLPKGSYTKKATAEEIKTVDLKRRPALRDHLVDRDCVVLDGHCDCLRNPNGGLPLGCKNG